jgi:hypothetical protein
MGLKGKAMEKDFNKGQGMTRTSGTTPAAEEMRQNEKPTVRYASDEQFNKAHKKAMKVHAGLFRRLAQ